MTEVEVINNLDPEKLKALMSNPDFRNMCVQIAQQTPKSDKKKSKKKDKKKKDKKKKRNKTMLGAGIILAAGGLTYGGVKYFKKKKDSENEGATNSFRI